MIDRFTAKAREAITLAINVAESMGHNYVGTEGPGRLPRFLQKTGSGRRRYWNW